MKLFFARHSLVLSVALRVAAATALVGAVLFALIYQAVAATGKAGLISAIDTDIAGLVDVYAGQGREGLVLRIAERLDVAPSAGEAPYYRLSDSEGRVLAGNLPDLGDINPGASPVVTTAAGTPVQTILVRVTQLRSGLVLAVGRSETFLSHGLSQLKWTFGIALTVMVAAAFGIGSLASLHLRARIQGLSAMFADLVGPSLRPLDTTGDEIDLLTRHVRDAAARIQRLLAAQRDISDNIAHETRTPLMMLENRLQAAMELAGNPELLIPLQAASAQTRSMLKLLDALLDIASAEAQRGDIKGLEYISLSEVARSISELYAASAEEAGVRLICEIDDEVRLQADAMQISRLLVNLLDNAFKYGASGAFIRLRVAQGPVIVVEDDGPGISESNRTRIFERYRRSGDGSRKGHGLGLALVKAIAERYGLVIHVETGEYGGARFVVAPGREP